MTELESNSETMVDFGANTGRVIRFFNRKGYGFIKDLNDVSFIVSGDKSKLKIFSSTLVTVRQAPLIATLSPFDIFIDRLITSILMT